MAPHSSTLAWKTPWTEEPGRLQSMGSQRGRHDWATSFSFFIFMHWRRKWQPTPVFLPGEFQGRESLVGCPSMGSHRVGHDWSDLQQQQQQQQHIKLMSISLIRAHDLQLKNVVPQCSLKVKRDFPSLPVVKTLHSQCRMTKFNPWSGN